MNEYKIFKLSNGQDVIARINSIEKSTKTTKLEQSMAIITSLASTGSIIVLLRPFNLLSSNSLVEINNNHILCQYEPSELMIEYYENMIEYNAKQLAPDLIEGLKGASKVLKTVNKSKRHKEKDDIVEKSLEYWESMMKSDKKH